MAIETVHMLKSRESNVLSTRCGEKIKVKSGLTMRQHGVVSWDEQVTCPSCKR